MKQKQRKNNCNLLQVTESKQTKGEQMINEEILKQLEELKQALNVVSMWMDKEEGKTLKEKTINEFIRTKTIHYRNTLEKQSKTSKGE